MDPTISVIVLAWNGEAFLEACLASVRRQDYGPVELIVVDNASSDRSAAVIEQHCPPARLIRNPANLGYAGGNNVGLRAAGGEIVVLLNQDAELQPGCLRALAEAFAQTGAGVVGGKAFYPGGQRLQHAGGWVAWPLAYAHHYAYQETDQGQWDAPRQVEFVTGAALGVRRAVLDRIGLLDEQFWPGYFEDVDLCLRAAAAGFEVWYTPAVAIIHYESPSTSRDRLSRYYQNGRLRLALKHLGPARFVGEFVPAELAEQAAAVVGGQGPALREAYLSVLADLPNLLRGEGAAERAQAREVAGALQQLYAQAWQADMRGLPGAASPPALDLGDEVLNQHVLSGSADLLPAYVRLAQARQAGRPPTETSWLELKEYVFRSSLPVVGPLVARVRQLWYAVAARWALLYLMQQQEAINRRQLLAHQALAQRVQAVAEEVGLLAARLTVPPADQAKGEHAQ